MEKNKDTDWPLLTLIWVLFIICSVVTNDMFSREIWSVVTMCTALGGTWTIKSWVRVSKISYI